MSMPCITRTSIARFNRLACPWRGANISNIGFHAPPQEPGWANDGTFNNQGYSSAPWTVTQGASSITWNSETFAQNQNANAIRWGTLYNFRFDADQPPQEANAMVGYFKNGSPTTVAIQAPAGSGSPTPTPTHYRYGYIHAYRDGHRHACYAYRNGYHNTDCDAAAYSNAKDWSGTETSPHSFASTIAGARHVVERVVLRKGAWPRKFTSCHHMPVAFYAAWLPRSFTLNALVRQFTRTPSQPDICAFGGEFTSSSEKPIHLRLIVAPRRFRRIFFSFCRHA